MRMKRPEVITVKLNATLQATLQLTDETINAVDCITGVKKKMPRVDMNLLQIASDCSTENMLQSSETLTDNFSLQNTFIGMISVTFINYCQEFSCFSF